MFILGFFGVLKAVHNLKNKIFTALHLTIIVVGVSRQFVKIMTARSTVFLHWWMEKLYGACWTFTFVSNFVVVGRQRCYIFVPALQIL